MEPIDVECDECAELDGTTGADPQLEYWTAKLRDVRHRLSALRKEEAEAAARVASLEATVRQQQADQKRRASALNWEGHFEWDHRVQQLLTEKFGFASFRPLQREVVNAVLSGKDVFVVMPTGSGKSLTFQLPALLWEGLCLVVSPLISLMQDQAAALQKWGISTALLTGETARPERDTILAMVGKPLESRLKLLYVTPELLAKSKTTVSKLQAAYKKAALKLMVIDECHCCSQWGHEFRPDYLKLAVLKSNFPTVPLLALTATATQRVMEEVETALGISGCVRFRGQYNRPNLLYEQRPKAANFADSVAQVAAFIRERHPADSGIVYCFSRKDCEAVAEGLRERGIMAICYHAQVDFQQRQSTHRKWAAGEVQVIVATIAFGMGIDKRDVRFVIHHTLSKSIENYYQESGRAGRDGQAASCLLLFRAADVTRLSSLVADSGNRQRALQLLYCMARVCDGPTAHQTCRRQPLAEYFGDVWQAGDCEQMCDVCCGSCTALRPSDMTAPAHTVLTVLADLEQRSTPDKPERVTLLQLAKLVKASKQEGTAAIVKRLSSIHCERLVLQLLLQGFLAEEFAYTAYTVTSYLTLSPLSYSVLQGCMAMPPVQMLLAASEFTDPKRVAAAAAEDSRSTSKRARADSPDFIQV
eukprot:GGOE01019475.1.p1 GENE.GGOE01019475.1~~GGOE01019475.1.p1  ORF type:complete len:658 (-),score=186.29 GGOE01019475.1:94-2031(-)